MTWDVISLARTLFFRCPKLKQVISRTHFWTSELLNTLNEGPKKNGLNTLQATRQKRDYSIFVGFFPRDFFLTSTFVDGLPGEYPLDMGWLGWVPEGFNIHQIGSPWIREVDACMGFTEDQELEINLYTAIYNQGGGF